jgi:hypothetical protein
MVVVLLTPESSGVAAKSQQPKMIKSFAALAIFAFLGTSVVALPAFAPKVEASEVAVLAKGDRLQVRTAVLNCSTQVWPDLSTSCLRNTGSAVKVLEARLVTARR